MSTGVTFNGSSYTIPALADASWGTNVSNYLIAIASGCLQKTGGAFTLSAADVDFGATYGLKSAYFKSRTANIATTGILELAKTDTIAWRNNANGADISLGIDSSDNLIFNSLVIANSSGSQTFTNKLLSDSTVKFANVSDATKLLMFSLGGATTGKTMTLISSHTNNRSLTFPDATDTFAVLATQQTFTNKILSDSTVLFGNVSDTTKALLFSLGGATTGKTMTFLSSHTNNRTLTFPDATDTLATLAATQAFTNKDYQGGTASDTSRITLPKASSSTLSGLTRKQGTVVYDSTLNQVFSDDGTNLNPIGSGAGEKNYITTGSSNAAGWTASGVGVTVATDTTAADLPRAITSKSGILISRASGSTAYAYYRFTLDSADYNKKLKIAFAMKPGGSYVASDFKVDMYSNTAADYSGTSARLTLSTDSSAVSALPNATLVYQTTFDSTSSSAPYMELRVGLNASTSGTTIVISDVIVGPGIITQGTAVSPAQAWTPTSSTWTSNVTFTGQYWRIGSRGRFHAKATLSGAPSNAALTIAMPTGLTIDSSVLNTTVYATSLGEASASIATTMEVVTNGNTSTVQVVYTNSITAANIGTLDATHPVTWANGNTIDVWWEVPVSEWAGSGTVNVVQNDTEYASNSSTADSSDTTSFVYGPSGSVVPGALTATRKKRVSFQTPIQATDLLFIEIQVAGTGAWIELIGYQADTDISPLTFQNSVSYGVSLVPVTSTTVDAQFGRYSGASGSTFGAAGAAWSSASTTRWRVRKAAGGQAIGFGNVAQSTSGLVKSAGQLQGTNTNDVAAAGFVGEYIEGNAAAGAVSLTSGTNSEVASASFTAGCWDLQSIVVFSTAASTSVTRLETFIGTASGDNTTGKDATRNNAAFAQAAGVPGSNNLTLISPVFRVNITATTTYYAKTIQVFSISTMTAGGTIHGTRVR